MSKIGLYWLTNDLRVNDNISLSNAISEVDHLICVYCIDLKWLRPNLYGLTNLSIHRWRFLRESLENLDERLRQFGQHLLVCYDSPVKVITELSNQHNVSFLYHGRQTGYYEQQAVKMLQANLPTVRFIESDNKTLFELKQLPFDLASLPKTFTQFRTAVEALPINFPLPTPMRFPPSRVAPVNWLKQFPVKLDEDIHVQQKHEFVGGEDRGLQHAGAYFSSDQPSHYKEVRNELDGFENSTKFSPWLANGNLSVRQTYADLRQYEQKSGANESTYWIFFELLWHEYFQWYAIHYGKNLFLFQGIKQRKPLTSFYPERFQKWCNGSTPYPLVNACMKQLSKTGYLSNRGRQIVASCLVNELQLDWRFGAAYFEQQLIDYDVANNWGNWQYLAGVGADPRGKRHFDLNTQSNQYDPKGAFVAKWQGQTESFVLDSLDAAGWPIGF